jgi:hypothetical protein
MRRRGAFSLYEDSNAFDHLENGRHLAMILWDMIYCYDSLLDA